MILISYSALQVKWQTSRYPCFVYLHFSIRLSCSCLFFCGPIIVPVLFFFYLFSISDTILFCLSSSVLVTPVFLCTYCWRLKYICNCICECVLFIHWEKEFHCSILFCNHAPNTITLTCSQLQCRRQLIETHNVQVIEITKAEARLKINSFKHHEC